MKNFIWLKKPKNKDTKHSILPFLLIVVVILVIFNLTVIVRNAQESASKIAELANLGLASLESAKKNAEFSDFDLAKQNFLTAQKLFSDLATESKIFEGSFNAPSLISEAGQQLADAGTKLSTLAVTLKAYPDKIIKANASGSTANITDELAQQVVLINQISDNLNLAIENLQKIKFIPEKVKTKFENGLTDLENFKLRFDKLSNNLNSLLILLGHEVPHSYLILVQNNNELRPTGGFLGSIIFAEINSGILTHFDAHDIYEYDGQLNVYPTPPPEFKGFVNYLGIRDANFDPDFPTSATLIEKMLQESGAPSAETIISVDQSFLEDILHEVGPITLDGFPNGKITANNFYAVLTYLIEDNQNKNIAIEFASKLKKKIFATSDMKGLANLLLENAQAKHIQAYSKNPLVETLFDDLGVNGKVPQPSLNEDFLMVTNSSIGGNKTDRFIDQRIIHSTEISRKGKVINTVTVRKFHSFTDAEEYKWESWLKSFGIEKLRKEIRHILGRGDNVNMVKVYVPFGSKLISSDAPVQSFDDYFMFKMSLKPGEVSEFTLSYTTPFSLKLSPADTYKLKVISAPGDDDIIFEKRFSASASDAHVLKVYPSDYRIDPAGNQSYETILSKDFELTGIVSR